MRTLIGAADDPEPTRTPMALCRWPAVNTTATNTTAIITWPSSAAAAPEEPYRTTAYVGEPIRELTDD